MMSKTYYTWSNSLDGMVVKKIERNGKSYSWNDRDCVYYNDNGDESDYIMPGDDMEIF